jgi:hypothetical protein
MSQMKTTRDSQFGLLCRMVASAMDLMILMKTVDVYDEYLLAPFHTSANLA